MGESEAQATASSFAQASKLMTLFLLRIALLILHFGPSFCPLPPSLPPPPAAAGIGGREGGRGGGGEVLPACPGVLQQVVILFIRLRGLLDPAHPLWQPLLEQQQEFCLFKHSPQPISLKQLQEMYAQEEQDNKAREQEARLAQKRLEEEKAKLRYEQQQQIAK